MIEVTDVALRQAAGEGMDAFIGVFTGAYKKEIGGEMTAGTMSLLTGEQHSLLAYQIFRDEVMEGGFCQLIQKWLWRLYFRQSVCQSDAFVGSGRFEQVGLCCQENIR